MNKNVPILVNIKRNKKILLWGLYFIFTLVVSLLYFRDLKLSKPHLFTISMDKTIFVYIVYALFCLLLSAVFALLIKFVILNSKLQMHKKFFFMALVIGCANMVLIPFLDGADEYQHFCRAYEISEGNFMTPIENGSIGSTLPSSLKELEESSKPKARYTWLRSLMSKQLNKSVVEAYDGDYVNTSLYSMVQYIPQSIGIFIAKSLNFNVYFVGMFGRLFGFLFWLVVTTHAIKIVPRKKVFFIVTLLSSLCISHAITLSGDMMLNSILILLIAYIYKWWCDKKVLEKKDYIFLTILCSIIALCKVVYIPIVLIIFFLPKECFKNGKKTKLVLIFIISAILSIVWFKISNRYLLSHYSNSSDQIKYIINHPIDYILIFIRTYLRYGVVYLTYISQVDLYPAISMSFWVIFILSLLNEQEIKRQIGLKEKLLYFIILIGTTLLMSTALYIQFTSLTVAVGNDVVDGVQMRYFLPMFFVSGLIINKKVFNIKEEKLLISILMFNLLVCMTMFVNYIA